MADDFKKLPVASASDTPATDFADPNSEIFDGAKAELRTRYDLLPDELKKVIMDDEYQKHLFEIAKAQKLTYDELGTLETETTMVLLGMTKPEEYRDELQVELKKNDAEVDAIVAAVNGQVFAPIRTSLERIYAAKKDPADYLADASEPAAMQVPKTQAAPVPAAAEASPIPVKPVQNGTPAQAVSPMPASALTVSEKGVLEKNGVVIENPVPVKPAAAQPIPARSDLLSSIENPPRGSSMIADKLASASPIITATKTTDYSVTRGGNAPQAANQDTAPRPADPYREPIN